MTPSLPPDLRVLCRKLASIPPAELPQAVPSLTKHIVRCRDVLSSPQEQKPSDSKSQSSQLLGKLRTSITTLLTGRSREARFAAVCLVKSVVDVGGWEILRNCEPWVRGLLSVVQPFQTLAREVATPSIPAFITACLRLAKPQASTGVPAPPLGTVETVCDSFSTLIPLYPTTFRPFNSPIKSAIRGYLAPALSDGVLVPESLRCAARRLAISLHCVAAKAGGSEDWAKLVDNLLRELHCTADQVLRAVHESWEGTFGYNRQRVGPEGKPRGGSHSGDQLPPWEGLESGAERLQGIFDYLAECLRYPTKASVVIPLGAFMDAISRVCLVARQHPKSQPWDQAVDTNAAISREEKDELWSVISDMHLSALGLALLMVRRFGQGMIPLVPEMLDHLVRVFKSGIASSPVRVAGYQLLNAILPLVGPTLSKATVVTLEPFIGACCRDLQEDAGFLKPPPKPSTSLKKNDSLKSSLANADLFLQRQGSAPETLVTLDAQHKAAAAGLLARLLSTLPQHHLKPTLRGLLDKTAILTANRDAMLLSVLNPYKDPRGRIYPNILPHLTHQFPQDQGLEILRSNLRTSGVLGHHGREELADLAEIEQDEEDEEDEASPDEDDKATGGLQEPDVTPAETTLEDALEPLRQPDTGPGTLGPPVESNPFEVKSSHRPNAFDVDSLSKPDFPAKRKPDDLEASPSKRQETSKPAAASLPEPLPRQDAEDAEDDESDESDESVHLNMELDEDEDEDEGEDEDDEKGHRS
ncbi:hypothetical protein UVI_02025160 [Ustilaginoidea virens]|uniref:Pre-rRNA-processing protein RIX1 n=1 Tax=Ustilaginoidea virens TaxID=1159556 RepID=A0A1B5KR98_USTVR|nr:hypothetical protein UVI_02025160 [Ustilaginoidea virens]